MNNTPSPENMRIAEQLAQFTHEKYGFDINSDKIVKEIAAKIAAALQAKDDAVKAEKQILVEGLKIALDSLKSYQDRTGQTLDDTLNGKWTNPPAEIKKLQDAAQPLGASGHRGNVQHGDAPLPCNAVLPEMKPASYFASKLLTRFGRPEAVTIGSMHDAIYEAQQDAIQSLGKDVADKARRAALEEAAKLFDSEHNAGQTIARTIRSLIEGEKA